MKVLIREGSAAKNFNSLYKLIDEFPDMVMLCSDDKHPEDLMESHINKVAARAVKLGCNIFNVIKASSINAIKHYNIGVGYLKENHKADFAIVDNLNEFNLQELYIDGNKIYDTAGGLDVEYFTIHTKIINNFNAERISISDIAVEKTDKKYINCIDVIEGELITRTKKIEISESIEKTIQEHNLNKIIVLNRYSKAKPAVGYIHGFAIKNSAIGSTIAHDCHNLICIGDGDENIVKAANSLIDMRGGISFTNTDKLKVLSLEIGGIMTNKPVDVVAAEYKAIESFAKSNGCLLNAPFMTMAFMALLVIPELKISDKGLFDITSKDLFVPLFQD
jgi:adenine deaminase